MRGDYEYSSVLRTKAQGSSETVSKTAYFSLAHNGHYWWMGFMFLNSVAAFFLFRSLRPDLP